MNSHPQSNDNQQRQRFFGSVILTVLILITMVIIYISYHQEIAPTAFFARSINDASYDCEDKIQSRYKDRLINHYFDQYSSRYDADDHQYIIYYRVSIQDVDDNDRPQIVDLMAKCTVWEKLGYVSDFQVFEKF